MWNPSAWKWGGFSILRLKSAQQGSFPAILWAAVSSSVFCNKIDCFGQHCSIVLGSSTFCWVSLHLLVKAPYLTYLQWSKCKFQKENSCQEQPYSGSVRIVRNWVSVLLRSSWRYQERSAQERVLLWLKS